MRSHAYHQQAERARELCGAAAAAAERLLTCTARRTAPTAEVSSVPKTPIDRVRHGSFYKAPSRAPRSPPARAKILSHARSSAERHPCAASLAHSPPPSCHVEAVGQHRGQDAAHPHCQPPRDVVAPLCLAPSPLQLPVGRPAPSNGLRLQSHATPQCYGAGLCRTDSHNAPWMLPRLYILLGWGSHVLLCSGRSTTRN